MRKHSVWLVALLLVLIIVSWLSNKVDATGGKKSESKQTVAMSVFGTYNELLKKINVEDEKPKRPEIPNIDLPNDLLDFIWNKCQENDISYTLVLAIAKQESDLGKDRRDEYNKNGTVDIGLMRVNSRNIKELSESIGLKNPDPHNDFDNVAMAIEYIKRERDYFRNWGMSEEQVYFMTVLSYNMWHINAINWVREHGWHSKYVENVTRYKNEFEQNEVIRNK
jgi:hypothetical protein